MFASMTEVYTHDRSSASPSCESFSAGVSSANRRSRPLRNGSSNRVNYRRCPTTTKVLRSECILAQDMVSPQRRPYQGAAFLYCQQPACEVVVGVRGDEDSPRPYCSKHNTSWKRAGLREPFAE